VVAALGDGCGGDGCDGSDGEPRVAATPAPAAAAGSGRQWRRSATAAATPALRSGDASRLRRPSALPPHQD